MAAEKLADNGLLYIHVGTFHRDSNFCQFAHIGVLHSFISLFALKDALARLGLSPVHYSENPFELVLKKAPHDEVAQQILETAQQLTIGDMEKFARKTLKVNRLKLFRKAKLKLNVKGREAAIRIKDPIDEYLPVSFVHDTPIAPILLK